MPDPASAPSLAREESEAARSVFERLDLTPENHFALHFHAAVYALLAYLRSLREQDGRDPDRAFEDYPFLGRYLAEDLPFMPEDLTWREGTGWWLREIEQWENEASTSLPLRRLTDPMGLILEQRILLVLIGSVEEDGRIGELYAELQGADDRRRPSMDVVGRVLGHATSRESTRGVVENLLDRGLVAVEDRSLPRSEWTLRVPQLLWSSLHGDRGAGTADRDAAYESIGPPGRGDSDTWTARSRDDLPGFGELVLEDSVRERVERVPTLLADGRAEGVLVRGHPGSDRRRILRAVARESGRGVVEVEEGDLEELPPGFGPYCTVTGRLPVVVVDLPPGASRSFPRIPGYGGPVAVALGRTGGLAGEALDRTVAIDLPDLSAAERRHHWQSVLRDAEVSDLEAIVERFHLPGRYLRRVGRASVRRAALEGRDVVTPEDVRAASRSLGREKLDTLADRVRTDAGWEQLVTEEVTDRKLRMLHTRCRHRERLLDHLGPAFGSSTSRGVSALFTGPSGTGKTMAARILSGELGKDLYRVDLAAVIDKYVGETEKNLHRVLTRAEELDVILLLDEGDALLGRRTDVSSANDRYANVETNYLLQRLEQFRGIALVTTNLGENIDPAFERRMDVVVEFTPPSAEERWAIWRLHLPEDHRVDGDSLRRLATRCELTGGQIRNAALQASLLALEAGTPVSEDHCRAAIQSEYRKAGDLSPLEHRERTDTERGGLEAFVRGVGDGGDDRAELERERRVEDESNDRSDDLRYDREDR